MNHTYDMFAATTESSTRRSGFSVADQGVIEQALDILKRRLLEGEAFTSPQAVKHYCQLQIAHEPDEYFCGIYLNSQHRLISFERMFRGTVDGASVYPRVVVRRALELNAAAVIFTHNHPSGVTSPSAADLRITERLQSALNLIDVRVLDHVIVGVGGATSLAETGKL